MRSIWDDGIRAVAAIDACGQVPKSFILSNMNLKSAALLTLIGMILLTILLAADLINAGLGVMRDVVPAMALLRSLVYVLASLSVTVFFYVFYKAQP